MNNLINLGNGLYKKTQTPSAILAMIGKKKQELEGLKEIGEDTSVVENQISTLKTKYSKLKNGIRQ